MQYFKPQGDFFVGDCMPFYHDGVFRLYYLIDEGHHQALGGLGGHQWAQASSRDLVHWTHYPLAIPITHEREGSICTGSVFFHEGVYYGFYATRMRDWTQHLSLATSPDGVHFAKTEPNPFASPPAGYRSEDYRDPVVFQDEQTGLFHLLATAFLEDYPAPDRGGCLAHLVSTDLRHWQSQEPFIIPGLPGAPECPDTFFWNGWYYLVFSNGGVARYRISRQPLGPWIRPAVDTLDGAAARVMKTARFTGDRRIGVAWLGTRQGDKDDGALQFGGNAVFREIIQYADGSLGTKFPAEMLPAAGKSLSHLPSLAPLTAGVSGDARQFHLEAPQGLAVAAISGLPDSFYLSLRINPQPGSACFGLRLKAAGTFDSGYDLSFSPYEGTVRLHQQSLLSVDGLDKPFTLEIVIQRDIIDVCIDHRRTLIDRCPERHGDRLLFYALNAQIGFENVDVKFFGTCSGMSS
jgi:hypothetical protein